MYQSRNHMLSNLPGTVPDTPAQPVPPLAGGDAVSAMTASGLAAPEETAPEETAPEETAPEETAPEETSPSPLTAEAEITPRTERTPVSPEDRKAAAEETGALKVSVTTASSAYPVRGATVEISSISPQGERGLLYVLVTDESGETPLVSLQAPPRVLSEKPGSDAASYARYDVRVYAPGYYPIIAQAVSVFAGATSLQPFALIPHEAGALYRGVEQVPLVYPESTPSAHDAAEKGAPHAAVR